MEQNIKGAINKIIRFSAVDGPGNRSAIFLQGCNYRCDYCHNPETIHMCIHCGDCVKVCPVGALIKENDQVIWDETICVGCDCCLKACSYLSSPKILHLTARETLERLGSARNFIRGITVSGGEATLQREYLISLFKEAQQYGLTTFIDSNGSYDFYKDAELLQVTDSVMLDVKAWNSDEYQRLTGGRVDNLAKNMHALAEQGKLYEIRTVIASNLPDIQQTIQEAAQLIANFREVRYKLIRYRPFGVREPYLSSLIEPTEDEMIYFENIARKQGVQNIQIV